MADESISFKDLVDARMDEMQSMKPGMYTEVTWKGKSAKVFSPESYYNRKGRREVRE